CTPSTVRCGGGWPSSPVGVFTPPGVPIAICCPDIGPGIAGCGPGGVPRGCEYAAGLYAAAGARPACKPPMLGARPDAASGCGVAVIGRCELGRAPGGGRGGIVLGRGMSRDETLPTAGCGSGGDGD